MINKNISINAVIVLFAFLLFSLLFRIFLPFGDEPDFIVRAPALLDVDYYAFSPYNLYSYFSKFININSYNCIPDSTPLSLWAHIPYECSEGHAQILIRWIVCFLILTPIFVFIIFGSIFRSSSLGFKREDSTLLNNSILLALLMPGLIYYLGVFAEEQLFLVISLFLFIFYRSFISVALIILILSAIDLGNTVVCSTFILFLYTSYLIRRFSRRIFFVFISSLVLMSLIVGYTFLDYVSNLGLLTSGLQQKSQAMFESLDGSDLVDKYPILLRPVVTFMTYVFMTPSGIKPILLYLIFGYYFLFISFRVFHANNIKLDLFWFLPIAVILFFVFLFPTYGNAKYYVFTAPFFMYVAQFFYRFDRILLLLIFSNIFLVINLILFRL